MSVVPGAISSGFKGVYEGVAGHGSEVVDWLWQPWGHIEAGVWGSLQFGGFLLFVGGGEAAVAVPWPVENFTEIGHDGLLNVYWDRPCIVCRMGWKLGRSKVKIHSTGNIFKNAREKGVPG